MQISYAVGLHTLPQAPPPGGLPYPPSSPPPYTHKANQFLLSKTPLANVLIVYSSQELLHIQKQMQRKHNRGLISRMHEFNYKMCLFTETHSDQV